MNPSGQQNPKVVVTGADGFMGRNLISHLERLSQIDCIKVDRSYAQSTEFADMLSGLGKGDVIFHLAGINRTSNEDEFHEGNDGFTSRICEILESNKTQPVIIYSSSIHVTADNVYGKSKKRAEVRLQLHGQKTGATTYIYRLPNVFGKWSRPNHNSAVATFCHNIANGLPITVHDPDTALDLLYIDDICEQWIQFVCDDKIECDENGLALSRESYSTTVGELAEHITRIRDSRDNHVTEPVGDGLERTLHATYLSFLTPEQFTYPLTQHSDHRGSFAEFIRTKDSGQVSVFSAIPGEIRGGHYHHTKAEKFLVVQGRAVFRFRNIADGTYHELNVEASELKVVETVPGWAHDLKNIGDEQLVCVLWANECFDADKPDTYSFQVTDDQQT